MEEIRHRFFTAHLKDLDPTDISSPFFVNTTGACIVAGRAVLRWDDFALVTGVGRFTSQMVRLMQSQFILESDNQLLKAAKIHMLAHSEAVNKVYYQDRTKQRHRTQLAQATYNNLLGLVNDLILDHESFLESEQYRDREQLEREVACKRKVRAAKVDHILRVERERQSGLKRSKERWFNAGDQTAVVECILLGTKYDLFFDDDGTPWSTAEMFLHGFYPHTVFHISAILRLLFYLPPEEPCVKALVDSLVGFAQLGLYSDNRTAEWRWAEKVAQMIRTMGRASWINNWIVLHRLAHFNIELGQLKFYFGNPNAFQAISLYQSEHMNREAGLEGQLAEANKDNWMSRQKFLALEKARREAYSRPETPPTNPGSPPPTVTEPIDTEPIVSEPSVTEPAANPPTVLKSWPEKQPKPEWSDLLKLELLMVYALHAPDPFSRSSSASGKAVHRSNLLAMIDNAVTVEVPGHGEFLLESLATVDHFCCCLQGIRKAGFSKQKGDKLGTAGLVHAMDKSFQESGCKRSIESLRARLLELRVWLKEKFVQE